MSLAGARRSLDEGESAFDGCIGRSDLGFVEPSWQIDWTAVGAAESSFLSGRRRKLAQHEWIGTSKASLAISNHLQLSRVPVGDMFLLLAAFAFRPGPATRPAMLSRPSQRAARVR